MIVHNTCSKEDIIKYVDDAEELAKLPNGPIKEAVEELKILKTSSNSQYNQFLDDFENGVDLSKLGSGGVKAWESVFVKGNAASLLIRSNTTILSKVNNLLSTGIVAKVDLEFFVEALSKLKKQEYIGCRFRTHSRICT